LVLQARGQADEAITQFRRAAQLDPKNAQGHVALANALLRRGRFPEARTVALRGLELIPGNAPRLPALRQTLEQCDRMLALDAALPGLLQE
jgi:Flp pilus assembly protein TadD